MESLRQAAASVTNVGSNNASQLMKRYMGDETMDTDAIQYLRDGLTINESQLDKEFRNRDASPNQIKSQQTIPLDIQTIMLRNKERLSQADARVQDIQREYRKKFSQRTLLDDIQMENNDEAVSMPDFSTAMTPHKHQKIGLTSRITDVSGPSLPGITNTKRDMSLRVSPRIETSHPSLFSKQSKANMLMKHQKTSSVSRNDGPEAGTIKYQMSQDAIGGAFKSRQLSKMIHKTPILSPNQSQQILVDQSDYKHYPKNADLSQIKQSIIEQIGEFRQKKLDDQMKKSKEVNQLRILYNTPQPQDLNQYIDNAKNRLEQFKPSFVGDLRESDSKASSFRQMKL